MNFTTIKLRLLTTTILMLCPILSGAQAPPPRVVEKISWRTEPVRMEKITANGTVIELGRKFQQEKDWFSDLTVSVKNVSNKAIARIEINVSFPRDPQAAAGVPQLVIPILHGLDPADAKDQLPLLPGESAELHMLKTNLPVIRHGLSTLGYPEDVSRVSLMLNTVTFADGSMWAGDEILYPDPKNPRDKINPRTQARASALFAHPPRNTATWAIQDPSLKCDTFFDKTQVLECGGAGSGCSVSINIFTENIDLMGLRNARKVASTTFCRKPDGSMCTTTPVNNFDRLPCGAKVAGTCGGAPDYDTYAATGCATGFTVIDGVCSRSLKFQSRCAGPSYYDSETCTCPNGVDPSPIVIDLDHSGFSLTDATAGVPFDMFADDVPLQMSWIDAASTNAFLVLDRNGNGKIDNGAELFGNLTPQPPSASPNGFIALAEFDKPANGGNGDGRIDQRDAVFATLRLWRDANHNGQSEPSELRPLLGLLRAIDLNYKESKRTDQFGNEFRYRAKVYDANGVQNGRWAWDVFLRVQ